MEYIQLSPEEKITNLKEKLIAKEMTAFFGLTNQEIERFLEEIEFARTGEISPMFLSPGYRNNDKPTIIMTFISNRPDTYFHEAKHGLHYKVYSAIFERSETSLEAFDLFCENVLGNNAFIELIEKKRNSQAKDIY
ncbi:MAG: hypothetical protein N2558_04610 [Patescibacteria group bacterium]|nr:hypothetical protein [Patescibacteria group bacterium]